MANVSIRHDGPQRAAGTAPETDRPLLETAIRALATVAGALFIVALPLVANAAHSALGLLTLAALVIPCALLSPATLVATIFCGFIFQNTIVSMLTGWVATKAEFDMMRAYNFFTVCIAWATVAFQFLAGRLPGQPALMPFLKASVAALALIGVYFLLGFALYGTLAIVNLRNIATPLLLFQISVVLLASLPLRPGPALTLIGLLLLFCGLAEFLFRNDWLVLTNGAAYWNLTTGPNWATLVLDKQVRETGLVAGGLLDTFRISLFNSPLFADLDIAMLRLFGPNMHAISFAYCLAFFSLFTLYRGRMLQALAFVVLLVLASAKGPVLVFLLAGVSWIVFQLLGSRVALALHLLVLAVYAVSGVILGMRIGDFHVLGLMAGLAEFVANPLGRGIGAGGNLSPLFSTINWYEAQAVGRTPFPVESSVGVLLYQMGIAAFAVIGVYAWIAWRLLALARFTRNALHAAFAFALMALIVNGLFQEEAYFAPLALSIYMALAGMMLGAGVRTGAIGSPQFTVK